jgi:hypothetical protein
MLCGKCRLANVTVGACSTVAEVREHYGKTGVQPTSVAGASTTAQRLAAIQARKAKLAPSGE